MRSVFGHTIVGTKLAALRFKGIISDIVDGLSAILPFSKSTIQGPAEEYDAQPCKTTSNPYGTAEKLYYTICQSLAMGTVSVAAARHFPKTWTPEGQREMQRIEPYLMKWLRLNSYFKIYEKALREWTDLPRSNKLLGMGIAWLGGQLRPIHHPESSQWGFLVRLIECFVLISGYW
ncbi:hypothetical protein G7Y89_g6317 [Cudoniella acicularis]|uniref:Uncharacterized protein n=1 Tax=Cudoniella acicularis TaxID=354080 RepID=A0A8H4RMX2_9HELO|nr:hypothetical protein G7Y89_g6317 [Cudoniella acicularis]